MVFCEEITCFQARRDGNNFCFWFGGIILLVALVSYENWLNLGLRCQVEEEVVEIDGCRKIVGWLSAEYQ